GREGPGRCSRYPRTRAGAAGPRSRAFNLDTGSAVLKDGASGSFFGFAVALHRQLTTERPHRVLLVGAPQAPALPSQGANRTGGLFACPLTLEPSDCWRVPIDDGGEQIKENQWLGVSVSSQGAGGKIVVSGETLPKPH
uniref:Uncharacterized protein n=1 Tax=Melopsittacus undulatus TaxID=13146 RepID=A0A8V5H2B0_MELUD